MAEAVSRSAGQRSVEPPTGGDATGAPLNDNTPLAASATLVADTMYCGTCMVSIEDTLGALDGVTSARVNLTTKRVTVAYDPGRVDVDAMIGALDRSGFPAAELIEGREAESDARDRDFLKRLGVAGFAAANVMLLSVSVWSGFGSDMGEGVRALFHWLSALIALPAIAYAGQPFFRSARLALKGGRLNMDVPISLGVILASAMSLFQTIRGTEHVYFDAAITLLFFLLIGRYLDQAMRTRAAGAAANLLGLKAQTAVVLSDDGTSRRVSSRSLASGDRVLIAAGDETALSALDSLFLEHAVDVTGRDGSFAAEVRVRKPSELVYLSTDSVMLMVEIGPSLTVRTFENVSLDIAGTADGLSAASETKAVSVSVTGPMLKFDSLKASAVKAYVDITGLAAGTYALPVKLSVRDMDEKTYTYAITPQNVAVTLTAQ